MDRSGLLSAWWMPKNEEALWEAMQLTTPHRVMFLTGVFVLLNSFTFSLVRLLFDRTQFTERDHVWIPHRFVECGYTAFLFLYSLCLYCGAEGDNSFLKDRVFMASSQQEMLSNVQSAYAVYSMGVALLNFKAFGKDTVWIIVTRGVLLLGINYLHLLYPCVLGARLRIYWGLFEIATVISALSDFLKLQSINRRVMLLTMASMLATLVRFWMTTVTLLWAYGWLSSENVWNGVPKDVPVSEITSAYLTGIVIGAVGWSYVTFYDFRVIVLMTKEWTEAHQKSNQTTTHEHQS